MTDRELKYRFCLLDRLWYAAEIWSGKAHNNLSGSSLFFQCWLWVVVLPVYVPLSLHYLGWIPAVVSLPFICLLPSLFCRLRYSPGRRRAIACHYLRLTHPVRELILFFLLSVLLTVVAFSLMFHLGFMQWAA